MGGLRIFGARCSSLELSIEIPQTGHSKKRGKIWGFSVRLHDLPMKCGDQGIGGTGLVFGNSGQNLPNKILKPNTGDHAIDSHGARPRLVENWICLRVKLTHMVSPREVEEGLVCGESLSEFSVVR